MNTEWLYGLINLTFLGYAAITAAMVQTTIMAVTLYLHRDAAHRSLDLHPILRHFFRFWIWLTSSMLTREWVAVHRKHHAFADRLGDPHSPVNEGLSRILLEGAELYKREARNPDTQESYGKGTPDDWIERRVYSRHRNAGIVAFVVLELAAVRRAWNHHDRCADARDAGARGRRHQRRGSQHRLSQLRGGECFHEYHSVGGDHRRRGIA